METFSADVSALRRSSSSSVRSMKLGFSTKSRGGYPFSASSGKTTTSAPSSAARRENETTLLALPDRSPTVELICASPMRMKLHCTGSRPSQLWLAAWLSFVRTAGEIERHVHSVGGAVYIA